MIRFAQTLLRRSTWFVAVFQAALIVFALLVSWLLRFDYTLPYRRLLLIAVPVLLLVRLLAIARFNLLHGWWRYAGISDVLDVIKAVALGSVGFIIIMHYGLGKTGFPRSVYVLEPVITAGLLCGVRLFSRVLAESVRKDYSARKRVMLIGAGSGAQTILREIRRPDSTYVAIGCLDDDPSKQGIRINDVPVLGPIENLVNALSNHPVDEVLIAVPSASARQMQRFVEVCNKAHVVFRTVPALKDIIAGEITVNHLREVSLEDLLGRDPVCLDLQSVQREIEDNTVLITGAAGSIGSELCRQVLNYGPRRLICLDQSETGLFFLRLELQKLRNGLQAKFCVADVCDRERVAKVLAENKPSIIFHAAAYKHVPMMESNVQEAVKNNVVGLLGLLNLAEEAGCKSFVLISSDKAVNPTNIMGATKRVGELIISSRPAKHMRCVSVRFGNVLGSNGSVIPVLQQQLQNHQPLTVTHPDVKRFFMTIREAVALVLQGFTIGTHGDILVLDMGEPVRIVSLARSLIRLCGKSEDEVPIRFTGLREGEKLEEELFYQDERLIPTSCSKIHRTRGPHRHWTDLQHQLEELRLSLTVDGAAPVRAKIKEIVPEYTFQGEWKLHKNAQFNLQDYLERAMGQD
jgi:FlaA1/EpsC-like NDP-sugar epimerase